ncbi:MAG: hypothetical protein LBT46_05975 [Planctomycetaceae bacterium]|jgi:type II secretory pathway component GspD/PulD (secretin)|nr:hypothetical protein [Planctomycetaceae bacterium]
MTLWGGGFMRIIVTLLLTVLFLAAGCKKHASEAVFVGSGEASVEKSEPAEQDTVEPPVLLKKPPVPQKNTGVRESTPEEVAAELQKKADEAALEYRKEQEQIALRKFEIERQEREALVRQEELRKEAEAKKIAEEARNKAEAEAKNGVNTALPVNTAPPVKGSPVNTNPPVNTASPVKQSLSLLRTFNRLMFFGVLLQNNDGGNNNNAAADNAAVKDTSVKSADVKENTAVKTPDNAAEKNDTAKNAAADVVKPAEADVKPPAPDAAKDNTAAKDTAGDAAKDKNRVQKPADKIRFNFRYTPWKDAIEWFADQAGLSLQADRLPPGTLNLTDNQYYSPSECLDVLNSYLLFKEFTVLRKGKSLFVIYLPDGIPPNLLEPITPDELDDRGKYEICRCVFNLNRTPPDIIQTETEKLLGPQGTFVLMPASQQIVITETAGTLRTIRDIIKRIDDPIELASGILHIVEPKNLAADEALGIMRKLMAVNESDASLRTAVDAAGKIIWMTGRGDMIERAKDIIKSLDDSFTQDRSLDGQPQFDTYDTGSADPVTVLAVLQTLLAGTPEIRLSLDARTGGIAVLGRPASHATVKEAIRQMQLNTPQIDVIPLKRISPLSAVESIKKFFATASPSLDTAVKTQTAANANASAPIVEADTAAQQIIVRGTLTQIQQIRALLLKLGEDGTVSVSTDTSPVRTIAIPSAATPYILEQLQKVLPQVNPAVKVIMPKVVAPENNRNDNDTEEKINKLLDEAFDKSMTALPQGTVFFVNCRYEEEKPVIVTVTPAGLMLTSNDTEALNQVEGLIRMLSDETILGKTELHVYSLKNSTAEVVSSTLQSLLGVSSAETQGVSGAGAGISDEQRAAVLRFVSQGNAVEKTGQVSIVVDARLNSLLIQANPVDHKTIERLLPILDQQGRDDILNRPRPRLIVLKNIRAEEALQTVETVFANRIQGAAGRSAQGTQNNNNNAGRSPARGMNEIQMQPPMYGGGMGMPPGGMPQGPGGQMGMIMQQMARMGNQGGGSSTPKETEAVMTLSTDSRSNSLIVSAPESLYLEVKIFVEELDAVAAQQETVVETVGLKNINSSLARQTIANTLGTSVTFTESKVTAQQQSTGMSSSPFGGFGSTGGSGGMFGNQGSGAAGNPFLNMFRGGSQGGIGGGGFGGNGMGGMGGGLNMPAGGGFGGGNAPGGFGTRGGNAGGGMGGSYMPGGGNRGGGMLNR